MNFLDRRELDPLLLGSPLRTTPVAVAISAGLFASIAVVAAVLLAFLGSLRNDVATEVGVAVTAAEYDDIVHDRMFATRRIDRLHHALSAALINAQNELAFRKRRVRDEGRDPEHDRLVAAWREEIRVRTRARSAFACLATIPSNVR
ncbi:MAG: hypothetical protein IT530_19100 [Burkholderiales bacterium]|nr:hypothetical protein [Burkholderiales bacterium]